MKNLHLSSTRSKMMVILATDVMMMRRWRSTWMGSTRTTISKAPAKAARHTDLWLFFCTPGLPRCRRCPDKISTSILKGWGMESWPGRQFPARRLWVPGSHGCWQTEGLADPFCMLWEEVAARNRGTAQGFSYLNSCARGTKVRRNSWTDWSGWVGR
jgi:hypothetical protein